MASTITFENHRPGFSEKIENFFRTTENIYETSGGKSTGLPGGLGAGAPGIGRPFPSRLAGFVRDSYELYVEVPSYKPEEVAVTTQDELIIISGKHEENHPEFGYQSKEFTHKYTLPKNIDKERMTCVFKERGYLKIEAPFVHPEDPSSRQIPIKIVNTPVLSMPKTSSSSSVNTNGTAATAATATTTTTSTVSVSHV